MAESPQAAASEALGSADRHGDWRVISAEASEHRPAASGGSASQGNCLSVGQSAQSLSRVRLCDPMDCSTLRFPVHHQLLELAHVKFLYFFYLI